MYNIAVCTNDNSFAKNLNFKLNQALQELNITYSVEMYEIAEGFLERLVKNSNNYQVLFFDLNSYGIKFLKFAYLIKKNNSNLRVVLIDNTPELAIRGYDIDAAGFMVKPIDYQKLKDVLKNDYEKKFKNQYIAIKCNSHIRQIKTSSIVFLETLGRKIIIHLKKESITFSGKLSNFEKILPKNEFIRCHQGYILNINEVIELNRTFAITKNGMNIPLSRTYQKDVRELFLKNNEVLTITGS